MLGSEFFQERNRKIYACAAKSVFASFMGSISRLCLMSDLIALYNCLKSLQFSDYGKEK